MMEVLTASASWAAAVAGGAGAFIAARCADHAQVDVCEARPLKRWVAPLMAAAGAVATFAAMPAHGLEIVVLIVALAYFSAFDIRFSAVPVWPLAAAILLGLAIGRDTDGAAWPARLGAAAAGLLVFVALDRGHRMLRGRGGLGFGDALVAALIGAWLSWQGLAWSVAIGAGLGIVFVLLRGKPEAPMPFAPALAAGAALFLARDFVQ